MCDLVHARWWTGRGAVVTGVALVTTLLGPGAAMAQIPANAKLPDLVTMIPQQLQIVNPAKGSKREVLRFSNGIANIGDGPWRMRPEFPTFDPSQPQTAIQELLDSTDSSGDIAYEAVVSQFEFHPEHNHWHIDGVALYEVRASNGLPTPHDSDIGPVVGGNAIKTTFCLIDWVRLEGSSNNGKNTDRVYWDCFGSHQGISVGWADQYHHATDGQELDLSRLPEGRYYLVSTANADRVFLERNYTNNRAWVAFTLIRFSQGNAKLVIVGDSFSIDGEGLSPAYTTNR
jgi:Lysyl oxidase